MNVSLLYHGFIAELQIHLRAILSIAERQHVAYEYAREMDLMGVLEPPVENTTCRPRCAARASPTSSRGWCPRR